MTEHNTDTGTTEATEAKRTNGKYVAITRGGEGNFGYFEADDKKTFSHKLSSLAEDGVELVKVYKGAKVVTAKVKQVVSF